MKNIIITCDTEVGECTLQAGRSDAFEVFIEGKVEGQSLGVSFINSIASRYKAIIEHCVDIYAYTRYGEKKFKNLCNEILNQGHSIALHTHPSSKYNKRYMYEFNLKEQREIVKFGKDKIKEWTGVDVIAHRAGGYGADNNTLIALKDNEILIDSSHYYKNSFNKIKSDIVNECDFVDGVFEIPVTTYKKQISCPFFKKDWYIKLDFRYGLNVDEILEVIDRMDDSSVIVLFLHSFNFLTIPYNLKTKEYKQISINHNLIESYERLLSAISERKDCKFAKFSDIKRQRVKNDLIVKKADFVFSYQKIKTRFSNWIYV